MMQALHCYFTFRSYKKRVLIHIFCLSLGLLASPENIMFSLSMFPKIVITNICYIEEFQRCIKLRCDTRFQHAFASCGCIFKIIT